MQTSVVNYLSARRNSTCQRRVLRQQQVLMSLSTDQNMNATNMTKNTNTHKNINATKNSTPNFESITEQLFSHLISGDRRGARDVMDAVYATGTPAETVAKDLFWPVLESVTALFRQDRMSVLSYQYATRILRMLVDQCQGRYTNRPTRNRKIAMFCGQNEAEELAGQMVADLLEADGYEITFAGGGVATDEIRGELGEREPDALLLFASSAKDAPFVRELIDQIRKHRAFPDMQIIVGGGIFNRAPGLAEEIGADVSATSPRDLLEKLVSEPHTRNERWTTTGQRNRNAA